MDAAVPFAGRGLRVRVITDSRRTTASFADADVLSVTTNSRHGTNDESRRIITSLQPWLAELQPDLLIKKIDSTLRGNVAQESAALNEVFRKNQLVVCPAVPAQNRFVIDGQVVVEGRPLSETAYASDIRSPAPKQSLKALFEGRLPGWTVRTESPAEPSGAFSAPDRKCIIICDAAEDDDLLNIVRRRQTSLQQTLFVGASGLTRALARVCCRTDGKRDGDGRKTAGPTLFLIGSLAVATAKQLARLTEVKGVTLFQLTGAAPLPDGRLQSVNDAGQDHIFVIKAPAKSDQAASPDPALVVSALARSAVRLAVRTNLATIVATGGDTAQALLAALEADQVTVAGEIRPGVVFGRAVCRHGDYNLVTKAGGFGSADLFLDILEFFDADS